MATIDLTPTELEATRAALRAQRDTLGRQLQNTKQTREAEKILIKAKGITQKALDKLPQKAKPKSDEK